MPTHDHDDHSEPILDPGLCHRVSRQSADGQRLAALARQLESVVMHLSEDVEVLTEKLRRTSGR